jgi:AcrR family transcriptional regulator
VITRYTRAVAKREPAAEPGSAPPKRKRLTAVERRDTIVTAARQEFVEYGFSGARTRAIAEGAGVTEAVLYRHFASKEAIFDAAVLTPLRQQLAALLDDTRAVLARRRTRRTAAEFERVWLERLPEIVPLLGAAVLSDQSVGRTWYRDVVAPFLDAVEAETVAAGLLPVSEAWVLVRAAFGMNLLLVLDRVQRGADIDVASVAGQLSDLYALGLSTGRSLRDQPA